MWMKVDDGLHAHRKTRAVIKSHEDKRRDAAPMGIWVLSGSWAAQNGTDGWVPEDELERWDEDWEDLASRLVRGGYWWPQQRDGEAGYGFNDWHDYNDPADFASKSGTYGNHVRWHINEKRVDPACEHCPTEPQEQDGIAPRSAGDRGAISGGDSHPTSGGDSRSGSGAIALPEPEPEPDPNPIPKTSRASADAERTAIDADFDEWWKHYPRKKAKGAAVKAYRMARKKASAAQLLVTLRRQTPTITARGDEYTPYPASWLNQERWLDEAPRPMEVVTDPSQLPPVADSWMRRKLT